MSKQRWPQEPWHRTGVFIACERGGVYFRGWPGSAGHSTAYVEAALDRAVACVNALAGIADPEAWVKAVRELQAQSVLARIRAAETGKEPG